MADGQPELIPMPDMSGDGEMPQLSRQLSPDEERAALLNFMGNMYGEAKKMDGNIVGPTNTLQRGKSDEIKKQIEQVYTQPQQPVQQVQAAPTPQPEVQQPVVQAQQPVEPVQQLPVQQQIDDNKSENESDHKKCPRILNSTQSPSEIFRGPFGQKKCKKKLFSFYF